MTSLEEFRRLMTRSIIVGAVLGLVLPLALTHWGAALVALFTIVGAMVGLWSGLLFSMVREVLRRKRLERDHRERWIPPYHGEPRPRGRYWS